MDKSVLGALIKKLRLCQINEEGKVLSQEELSLKIGWENPSTLSRIESGKVIPTLETVMKIGKALELDQEKFALLLKKAEYQGAKLELSDVYVDGLITMHSNEFAKSDYPVILIKDTSILLYANTFAWFFFLGKKKYTEQGAEIEKFCLGKSYIDMFFTDELNLKGNILNWSAFIDILVRNLYVVSQFMSDNSDFMTMIKGWRKYLVFDEYWKKWEEKTLSNLQLFNIPLTYNNPDIGEVRVVLTTMAVYMDNRFFIEYFTPANVEQATKMKNYQDSF